MTYYAHFDHTQPSPSPVYGWYDTGLLAYPNLPDDQDLVEMSQEEWDARLVGYWAIEDGTLVAYTPPVQPPSADEVYRTKLADGITITSTGTSSLNGVYPLDDASVALVGSIARDAAAGLGLPNDAPTVAVKDINSAPHDYDDVHLIALYKAERDLLQKMRAQRDIMISGGDPTWPPQTATIP